MSGGRLTAIAAFWLSRNITRPLQALGAVVERIRGGQYDAAVPVERRDEIGLLAEGLQLMGRAVEARGARCGSARKAPELKFGVGSHGPGALASGPFFCHY